MLVLRTILVALLLNCMIRWFQRKRASLSSIRFRRIIIVALVFYFLIYVFLTLLSRTPDVRAVNILPFYFLFKLFHMVPHWCITIGESCLELTRGTWYAFDGFLSFLLNIMLYVPLGYLAPVLISEHSSGRKLCRKVLFLSFIISISTEVIQFITCLGLMDVDDPIANMIGAYIGFYMFKKNMLAQN